MDSSTATGKRTVGNAEFLFRGVMALRPPRLSPIRCSVIVVLLIAIGAVHHFSGRHIGLYTFFVLPCVLASWSLGLRAGIYCAAASAVIVFASDLTAKVDAPESDRIVNAYLRFGLYTLVSWATDLIGRLLEQLDDLSRADALTGLGNRRAFLTRGAEEIRRAKRSNRPLSVLFLDLDNFKSVNDGSGHAAGDALLKRVASVLSAHLRNTDFPARLGGDEFAAILPETNGAGARRAGESLRRKLLAEFSAMGYAVSSSIGIATFVEAPGSFDEAMQQADKLMYSVKNSSKDAVLQKDFPRN